jgi:hypothetical protein
VKVSVEPVSARIPAPVVDAMPERRVEVEDVDVEVALALMEGVVWEEAGRVMNEVAWMVEVPAAAGAKDCGMEMESPCAELELLAGVAAAGVGIRVAVE